MSLRDTFHYATLVLMQSVINSQLLHISRWFITQLFVTKVIAFSAFQMCFCGFLSNFNVLQNRHV